MKLPIGVSLAVLIGSLGCSEPKETESITSAIQEPKRGPEKTENTSGNDLPETDGAVKEEAPTAIVPGSLRLVVVQPAIAIVRERKKREDSKSDIKQRERRKRRQDERISALQTALGATHRVTRVAANDAERSITAGLAMGIPAETTLPAAWMTSQRVLVLELTPGTDRTERGAGGFIQTGSSKVALFSPPATQPLYLEIAPRGLQVDTAEILNIVEATP